MNAVIGGFSIRPCHTVSVRYSSSVCGTGVRGTAVVARRICIKKSIAGLVR